jgi:hypothetical protein
MPSDRFAAWMLSQETRALLSRLDRLRSMVLQETMVPAAGFARPALLAIERFLIEGRRALRTQVNRYLRWLDSAAGDGASVVEAHRRFTFLKLRFNAVLTQLDVFAEAMSQRSEVDTGVFLAGLDAAARDALRAPGLYEAPPVVCYLARDAGGAIRRARTRLPGGGENPVALIRLPRERMVGTGVASSLVHEVGHQCAVLLELLPSLRAALRRHTATNNALERAVWLLWGRWISEIFADCWAVARVGIASTLGLIGLCSLPRAFVFRVNTADPHPTPWIRVKLSCAIGDALYPHPQWARLAGLWESFYPLDQLPAARGELLGALEIEIPRFVARLLAHRAPALGGRALGEVLPAPDRTPARLALLAGPARTAAALAGAAPTVAFAAVAQARLDGRMTPEEESRVTAELLRRWAVETTLAERQTNADRIAAAATRAGSRRVRALASLET